MSQSGSQRMGWRGALTLAVAVAALLGAAPAARAGQIYVLTSPDAAAYDNVDLGVVDTATGAYTQVTANVGGGTNLYNLAWNPTLQKFYTTSFDGSGSTPLKTLGTNGVLSASLGIIGNNMYGMAYQPSSNTIFGYAVNDVFGTINPGDGDFTIINGISPGWSSVNNPWGGRLAFHTGTLYGAANDLGGGRFGTFNTTTGTFSQTATNTLYENMVLASDGTTLYGLYGAGAGTQKLYTINPASGALSLVANITGAGLQNYFTGAAVAFSDPPAVPEPGTVGLALVGAGVLGVRAWRRRGRPATA